MNRNLFEKLTVAQEIPHLVSYTKFTSDLTMKVHHHTSNFHPIKGHGGGGGALRKQNTMFQFQSKVSLHFIIS
jgi:hypothetical protein